MAAVTVKRRINAPVEKVWESWADFGNIYKFNPSLKHSRLLNGSPKSGKGAKRQCDMKDGKNWIREEVIDYEPNKVMTVDIYEGTMPLKKAIGYFRFKQIGADQTEIAMTMEFEPKMGIVGKLMIPMMKKKFTPMLQGMLKGNDEFVTQGQLANAG